MRREPAKYIRSISAALLAAAFLLQDIAWAAPETLKHRSITTDTLSAYTKFQSLGAEMDLLVRGELHRMALEGPLKDRTDNLPFVPGNKGRRIIFEFEKKYSEGPSLIVPFIVYLSDSHGTERNFFRYEALVQNDGEISIRRIPAIENGKDSGDGYIASKKGKSPKELDDMRKNRRELLTQAVINDFSEITAYIRQSIEGFKERAKNPDTDWKKRQYPEFIKQAEEGIKRLEELYQDGKVSTFDAIVVAKEDYALGFSSEKEIGFAKELMALDLKARAQLLFHEAVCFKIGHRSAISLQGEIFTDQFGPGVNALRSVLRALINKKASTQNGIGYSAIVEDIVRAQNWNVMTLFSDQSDYGVEGYEKNYSWDHQLEEVFRQPNDVVFYGDFTALYFFAGFSGFNVEQEIKKKQKVKLILDKDNGVAGVWGIPLEVNELVKREMADGQPVMVDAAPFLMLVRLYTRGYGSALEIIREYVNNRAVTMSYESFRAIIKNLRDKNAARRQAENQGADAMDDHMESTAVNKDAGDIRFVFGSMDRQAFLTHFKKYVLTIDPESDNEWSYGFYKILEDEELLKQLWEAYMEESNSSEDNTCLRDRILKVVAAQYSSEKILSLIIRTFQKEMINSSYKALDVLTRIRLDKDQEGMLFIAIGALKYRKEIASAYTLAHMALYGPEEKAVLPSGYGHHPSQMVHLLAPESRNIYYYLQKIEESRRKGGGTRARLDNLIIYLTRFLDDWAAVPGEKGHTWYSMLRQQVHNTASSKDLKDVRSALCYWKSSDDIAMDGSETWLIEKLKESFSVEETERYRRVMGRFLKRLHEEGLIRSLEGDAFMDEMLKVKQGRILRALKESAPKGNKKERDKLKLMIELFYALNDRYSIVGAKILPRIKRGAKITGFMRRDYTELLESLDSGDHTRILSAVSRCRYAIKERLLYHKTKKERLKERLMELDHYLFLVGKEMLVAVMEDIKRANTLDDLRAQVKPLAAMGRFILASGLGGVDLEQFVVQLEDGTIKYSQLHDLTRALRTEAHKAMRAVNTNMRFVMERMRPSIAPDKVKDDVLAIVRNTKDDGESRWTNFTEEEHQKIEDEIIDNIIRDTGILTFDGALAVFNNILESRLTPEEDAIASGNETGAEIDLDDEFFRFGQPEVIPRERLLSLWSKKGLNLVKMTEENVPVPPGVIVSANLVTRPDIVKSDAFRKKVEEEIGNIRRYSKYPDLKLLLYARSGSAFLLPGLLVTIPNLGMNDKEAEQLADSTKDEWFAYDTYAEFIRAYAINILGIPEQRFQEVFNIYKKDTITGAKMREVCERYKKVVADFGKGQTIPENMTDQVMLAMDCVYDSWDSEDAREYRSRHRISQEWGSVVILQKGVFGNLNTTSDGRISGTGAGALRVMPDGREVIQGKFRFRSIGDQLMSRADQNYIILSNSERRTETEQTLEDLEPDLYQRILEQGHKLKEIFGHNQHFEFTVELNNIWINQSNDDIVADHYPEFVERPDDRPIARGHGVSGGAVRGWVANSFETAEKLLAKYNAEKPEGIDGVILLLDRVNPEMLNRIPKGVHLIANIISVHAETLAQKYGITAVYGVSSRKSGPGGDESIMAYDANEGRWSIGGHKTTDGEVISIDGHENQLLYNNSGAIFLGSIPLAERSSGKTSVESLSVRGEERVREMLDQEQWAEAMRKRANELTQFDRELLALYGRRLEGQVEQGELSRYLMSYRAILDKLAMRCESIDRKLFGAELQGAIVAGLDKVNVPYDIFIGLIKSYHPRTDRYRELLAWIENALSEKEYPDTVSVTKPDGRKAMLSYDDLGEDGPQYDYLLLHQPKREVRLVSFELDCVLASMNREEIPELFKALKAVGLKIAITSINPDLHYWYQGFPEIHGLVDFVEQDHGSVSLGRYLNDPDLALEPGEIMHIGNTLGDWGSRCEDMDIYRRQGFVSVISFDQRLVRTADILNRKYDAVISRLRKDTVYDLIRHWIDVPKPADELSLAAGSVIGDIKDTEGLADSIKTALEAYVRSGKKLVIAIEDGLGGTDFKMTQFSQAITKWKEEMVRKTTGDIEQEAMKRQLDRIVVMHFSGAVDLDKKLSDAGMKRAGPSDEFIFVFTKDRDTGDAVRGEYGEPVRPVLVEEEGLFTGAYYPLPEVIALSLTKELLGISVEKLLEGLSLEGVDISELNIEGIRSEAAFLIFKLIPRIERSNIGEFGDRFNRLVKFLRSA